ncbi:MAG TPA: hypothetical protein VK524_13185 [Polyangiaceae bacterium]|nr:hypothetical protein [Polyangiaceae bacterium]
MTKKAEQGEVLGESALGRLETDLSAALRRKPAHEEKLGGALRVLAPYSPRLRKAIVDAVETMIQRGSYKRPLYAATVRAVGEMGDKRASGALRTALSADDAGGLATLSAACFTSEAGLSDVLARLATSRHPQLAFAAEVARVARGESNGAHVASVAPKIKESHRISLCVEMFVPLLWHAPVPVAIAPALAVLRDAERHLGRWLVLAEIAVRAGDQRPLDEARERAREGPSSARAAWAMVAWALGGEQGSAPARPTLDLIARLSDRPSADRDPTFLFRLAEAGVPAARAMLENLTKTPGLTDATGARAALYLIRDHERQDLREELGQLAKNPRREAVRGLAAAALYDAGHPHVSLDLCAELASSKHLTTSIWGNLLTAAGAGRLATRSVIYEPTFRRVQLGWVE